MNTQLVFPLDIPTVIFTYCAAIEHWSSGCHNIEADSSDFTMEAVLSQQSEADNKWYLVVFFIKFLSLVEWNYEIYDKEMLAIIYVLEEWRYFLKRATSPVEI